MKVDGTVNAATVARRTLGPQVDWDCPAPWTPMILFQAWFEIGSHVRLGWRCREGGSVAAFRNGHGKVETRRGSKPGHTRSWVGAAGMGDGTLGLSSVGRVLSGLAPTSCFGASCLRKNAHPPQYHCNTL